MHLRYVGPVIDAHCHYDPTTIARAHEVNELAGLRAALHLWDVQWPPTGFEVDAAMWSRTPGLLRCHVPDLSHVGHPGGEERIERDLRDAVAGGAVGVKVWKNLGLWLRDPAGCRLAIDDPRLEPIWATAAELERPVIVHQGDVPAFFAPLDERNPRRDELLAHPEWWYGGGGFPALEQIHEEFEAVVAGHPATTFVGAHFGSFMSYGDVARMLDAYPAYHVDTAAVVADLGHDDARETIREIIVRHPQRVLFGTDLIRTRSFDMPDHGVQQRWDLAEFFARHFRFFETDDLGLEHPLSFQGDWTVRGLGLPQDVLRQLYWDNARRLLRPYAAEREAPSSDPEWLTG